jgi:hypothetical protein
LTHANQGVPTVIDANHAITHNNGIIVGESLITGNFTLTKAAPEKHAENLLSLHGQGLAAQYTQN